MLPDMGFLGIKHVRKLQAADNKMLFPDYLIERQKDMTQAAGRFCTTFKSNVLGQIIYFTCDPKNIQAMLATQFNDFEIGKIRFEIMGSVLGDGIVSPPFPT